ncbi:hypothetical protein [Sphingobacterium arenae]|uniref:DUF4297 domain-containing protein n=1 Tax=Sphingobacterium arenae TaxID=1280598 RepID=A0ABR7XY91_9SPHI|nr:hypothetical protein [Sphingobacterium arenae]MBD1424025.1 hypothetical protein [Sphingobacterium arenae]
MSGRDSIRGYIFQTITSVIASFNRGLWDYCKVEPATEKDKVDILFYKDDGISLCQQIKSSVNNFEKPDIIEWIVSMANDVPSSEQYELVLIGTASSRVNGYINKINTKKETIGEEPISVKITLWPFDPDTLESRIRDNLHSFFSQEGYTVTHSDLELMTGALIYQFFQFSIVEEKVSHQQFREKLLGWAKSNYPKLLKSVHSESDIKVYFYNAFNRTKAKSFVSQTVDIGFAHYFEMLSESIISGYKKAEKIKLSKRNNSSSDTITKQLTGFSIPQFYQYEDADFSISRSSFIQKYLTLYFDISLDGDFFFVGNLKRTYLTFNYTYHGTQDEREKMELLNDLYFNLRTFVQLKQFCNTIESGYTLPLVASNEGNHHDEEIIVQLAFPVGVGIITADQVDIPTDEDALDFLIDQKIIEKFFCLGKDSKIEAYPYMPLPFFPVSRDMEVMDSLTNSNSVRDAKKQNVKSRLENYLDFEMLENTDSHLVVEYYFRAINPNITMAFPGLLFFRSENNFELKYEVRSKHSGKIRDGVLKVTLFKEDTESVK